MRTLALDDAIVGAAAGAKLDCLRQGSAHPFEHFGCNSRKARAAAAEIAVAEQRTENPGIDRQGLVASPVSRRHVDPQASAVASAREFAPDLLGRHHARSVPIALVPAPQALGPG